MRAAPPTHDAPVTETPPGDPAEAWGAWRAQLVDAGLLLPLGIDGLYGLGPTMDALTGAVDAAITELWASHRPEVRRFPPVIPTGVLERAGYVRSFPNLIGAVHSFAGDGRDHAALLRDLAGGRDWSSQLSPAGTALCSAACHPLYATLPSPVDGRVYEIHGWVFRHEPSLDPARLQAFRQHEFVVVGREVEVVALRNAWIDLAAGWLDSLGLGIEVGVAHDPFFGRAGRVLADRQVEAAAKYEVLVPTSGSGTRTAVASANLHGRHFAEAFGLATADGAPASSACTGFGVERVALALLWQHGTDVARWDRGLRRDLGL